MANDLATHAHIPSVDSLNGLAQHAGGMQRAVSGGVESVRMVAPRVLKDVIQCVHDECALAGEDVFYSWTVKDKKKKDKDGKPMLTVIEGLSIDGAMICARNFGNCSVEALPVIETPTAYLMPAQFVDNERGFTVIRQFRQAKNRNIGADYKDDGRADEIKFAIGQSKALRNVIVAAIPPVVVAKAMDAAKADIRKKVENNVMFNGGAPDNWRESLSPEQRTALGRKGFPITKKKMLDKLEEYGVGLPRVLEKFGRSTPEGIMFDDMVIIFADLQQLKNRTETPEHLYPMVEDVISTEGVPGFKSDDGPGLSDLLEAGMPKEAEKAAVEKPESKQTGDALPAGGAAESGQPRTDSAAG